MTKQADRVGVLVGRGKERDHLEMVVAFSERENAPKLGSFLVIEEQEFKNRKFLSRVEDMNYGDFQATKDERIRAIVEKYMREIAGYGRELSEEEKKTLFFRHYILKVVGEIRADGKDIVTEYRLLPELSSVCRFPTDAEYSTITNAGIQNPASAMKVGKLVLGTEEKTNDVLFEPWKFEKRRTAIFARTGYGKSNLCKVVVSLASRTGNIGILVLDMDGEYAFKTKDRAGKEVLGLADIEALEGDLVVYTQRQDMVDKYRGIYISPIVNLELIQPFYLAKFFEDQELATMREFMYMPKDKEGTWRQFIQKWRRAKDWRQRDHETEAFVTGFTSNAAQQRVLRRNLRPLLQLDSPQAPNLVQDAMYHLSQGRLVVLDLSLMPLDRALLTADLLVDGIFNYNIRGVTAGKLINAIAVFEEAQNVLHKDAVKEGKTVFARWAKEGRKFQLGLIYVTQQPGAIAEEIVSQTDNFFVMHLLSTADIDALRKANPHYDGVIADFLTMETIVGNTYIYSAPLQPYVFPAKVAEFSKDFFRKIPRKIEPMEGVLKQLEKTAKALSALAGKRYAQWTKFVGACSYKLYEYFRDNDISIPFLDHEMKRIDYAVAENLAMVLGMRGLLKLPIDPGTNAPETPNDREADGE